MDKKEAENKSVQQTSVRGRGARQEKGLASFFFFFLFFLYSSQQYNLSSQPCCCCVIIEEAFELVHHTVWVVFGFCTSLSYSISPNVQSTTHPVCQTRGTTNENGKQGLVKNSHTVNRSSISCVIRQGRFENCQPLQFM